MKTPESNRSLKRSLSLLAVVALGINGVIGQGIFLLPGKAFAALGPASLLALIFGGFLCFLIALCFAEVASYFDETGGAYIYTKRAYGEFVGFQVGWLTCCIAVISWAALANGLMVVLAKLMPSYWQGAVDWFTGVMPGIDAANAEGVFRKSFAVVVMTGLMLVNLFGARQGAAVSTVFSVAKLLPMIVFVLVGLFFIEGGRFTDFAPHGWGQFDDAVLTLLYAYAGFETLVVPAGEMKNPQRNVPLALMIVMVVVTVVYIAVLGICIGTFDGLAGHDNPVAASAEIFMGTTGGLIIGTGIAISVFGTNAGAAFVSPRRFFAMADRGELPKIFARVDERSGAPRPAIVLTWALACVLCWSGSFIQLAIFGVIARLLQYIPTCLAVIVLRKQGDHSNREGFRVAGGAIIPCLQVPFVAGSFTAHPLRNSSWRSTLCSLVRLCTVLKYLT